MEGRGFYQKGYDELGKSIKFIKAMIVHVQSREMGKAENNNKQILYKR